MKAMLLRGVNNLYDIFCLSQFQSSDEGCVSKGTTQKHESNGGIGAGAIFGICVVIILVLCIGAWFFYAYRYPTSKSGLFLIDVSLEQRFLQ